MTSTKKITKIMHNGEEYELGGGGYYTVVITLTSGGWSNNSQTANVTGVTSDSTIIVSPEPSSIPDYADCGVYCSAQGSGTLTFSCTSTPTNNIVVNCIVMNEGNVIIIEIPLKSYEEIIAMSAADAIAELNTHPTDYYNKLNSEGHTVSSSNIIGYISGYYYYMYDFANGRYREQDEAIAPGEEFVRYNNGGWTYL